MQCEQRHADWETWGHRSKSHPLPWRGGGVKMSFQWVLVMKYKETFPCSDFMIPYKSYPAINFQFPNVHVRGALNTYPVQCPQMILRKIRSRIGGSWQNTERKMKMKPQPESDLPIWEDGGFLSILSNGGPGPKPLHLRFPAVAATPFLFYSKLRTILFYQLVGTLSHMLWSLISEIWMGVNNQRQKYPHHVIIQNLLVFLLRLISLSTQFQFSDYPLLSQLKLDSQLLPAFSMFCPSVLPKTTCIC